MPDPFPGLCLDLEQPGLLYDAAELGTGFVALAWRNAAGEWPPPGEQADEPGPLVWLRTTASVPADTFVRLAVAAGLPVSAAVDSATFLAIKPKSLLDHQYVTALPAAGAAEVPRLLALLEAGAQILFYGPVSGADPELLARLGLAVGAPL
ncbi:MAG: hypothetical protein HUU35_18095, partial [Armatimonadetes bacterium]|nr:hypothetical protein [Armatimonadota bacterium]